MIATIPQLAFKKIGNQVYSFVGGDINAYNDVTTDVQTATGVFWNKVIFTQPPATLDNHLALGRMAYTLFQIENSTNVIGYGYFDLSQDYTNATWTLTHVDIGGNSTVIGTGTDTTWTISTSEVDLDGIALFTTFTVNPDAIALSPWNNMTLSADTYQWTLEKIQRIFSEAKSDKFYLTPYVNLDSKAFKDLSSLTNPGFIMPEDATLNFTSNLQLTGLSADYLIEDVTGSWQIWFRRNTNSIEIFWDVTGHWQTVYDGVDWLSTSYAMPAHFMFGNASFVGNSNDFNFVSNMFTISRPAIAMNLLDAFRFSIENDDELGNRITSHEKAASKSFHEITPTWIKYRAFDVTVPYFAGDIVNFAADTVGNYREMVCTADTNANIFDETQWEFSPDLLPVTIPFEMNFNDTFMLAGITFYYRNRDVVLNVTQDMLDTLRAEVTSSYYIPRADENFLHSDLYMMCGWEDIGSFTMFWRLNDTQNFASPRGPLVNDVYNRQDKGQRGIGLSRLNSVNGVMVTFAASTDGTNSYYDLTYTPADLIDPQTRIIGFKRNQLFGDPSIDAKIACTWVNMADGSCVGGYVTIGQGAIDLDGNDSYVWNYGALQAGSTYALQFILPANIAQR